MLTFCCTKELDTGCIHPPPPRHRKERRLPPTFYRVCVYYLWAWYRHEGLHHRDTQWRTGGSRWEFYCAAHQPSASHHAGWTHHCRCDYPRWGRRAWVFLFWLHLTLQGSRHATLASTSSKICANSHVPTSLSLSISLSLCLVGSNRLPPKTCLRLLY